MNKLTIPMVDPTDGALSAAVREAQNNGAQSRSHDDNADLFILEGVSDDDAKAIAAACEAVHVLKQSKTKARDLPEAE